MTVIITNNFIDSVISISLSIITLSLINVYYGVFIFLWATFFVIGSFIMVRELNKRASIHATEEAKTTGTIVDVYSNISAVKVYGESSNQETAYKQIDTETKALQKLGKWEILTLNFQGTSMIILSVGIIWITSILFNKNLITIGAIVFVSTATLRLFNIVWSMTRSLADFIRARGESLQNLKDLVVAPAILDGDHIATKKQEQASIEYRNVVFGYNDKQPILNNLSLVIKPQEKVGIVGLSGAGKTTLANLLLRFFDLQQGAILINGVDIKDFTQEFLRSHISYISQDTSLFHASIAENIAYGSAAASQADIEKAAQLAYASEFITTLPEGYESIVGERGVKLSGGQRQRIAIARALLANRPLFLLDEATSALDSDSEQKIQKGLIALMEDKTVIAIAHRLSTLSHLDRIIFLKNGKILEDGTHDELLKLNGKYATLWHLQAGGFLPDVASL